VCLYATRHRIIRREIPLKGISALMPAATRSKSEIRLGFFELLFEESQGYLCLATTDPRGPKSTFQEQFFEWPRESLKIENFILTQEVPRNVYFGVNLLKEPERKKKQCLPTDLVWADLDGVNPDGLEQFFPPIVVQSSPGRWQAFWRLESKIEPFDAERYSRRIAYAINADRSGWDLTQLFRVPLTKNLKYHPPALVMIDRALETRAEATLFEMGLQAPPEEEPLTDRPLPDVFDADEIIAAFKLRLDFDRFLALYTYEPEEDEDWSSRLWSLEILCFRAGMSPEEVFTVARESACNKYARDGRPVEHLWREVLKCNDEHGSIPPEKELVSMPQLVGEPASETFIDEYKEWACEATDAVPEFHELSAFIVLSSIVAASVRLETSYGKIAPNIWGLILGDSTVTRKSTSMKMAVDLLATLEPELILATDGSVEGLLSGLATRPNKVSVFFRDEVSGLFDSINRRDYLSSMPETLANLYDVPQTYSRLLRKEVIRIDSPAFIFFGGGITERVYNCVSEDWIESGFMPRFLIVSGDFNREVMRPTGPPSEIGLKRRNSIIDKLVDLKEHYAVDVPASIGGQTVLLPPRIMADMTQEAWERYQSIESQLVVKGYDSLVRNTALPTFDRMARSVLKMAMTLAATRQVPNEDNHIEINEDDIINAAWYVQKWGHHSVDLITNAGKAPREKYMDRVLRKIANTPGINRSVIMQHLHLTKREMDEIVSTLEDRGQIYKKQHGRACKYWAI
jgi:hypothetical protein